MKSVFVTTILIMAFACGPLPLGAVEFVIVNQDPPGVGLNDPEPRMPLPGNDETTLGEQRMRAFQAAADVWGQLLVSDVTIVVDANFDSLRCTPSSASLGFAGPASSFADFEGAPLPGMLYPSALADSLAGLDLDPGVRDIVAKFNRDLDDGCFLNGAPGGWYYGLDGNPPTGQLDIFPILLHELAHGLGFSTSVDLATGRRCCSTDPAMQFDDPFMTWLEDHSLGLTWPQLSDAQRQASARRSGQLHWVGPHVRVASALLSNGRVGDHVQMHAPSTLDPGSSVSHFATSLLPNELLEPLLNPRARRVLTEALLEDVGWTLSRPAPSTPTPTATATIAAPSPTPNDDDPGCDGRLSVADITAVIRIAAGMTSSCPGSDIDGDGDVDAADLAAVVSALFQ